ncbi:MAG: DEAD/DEAH box helicase [Lewinella sp.]|nr:DEAD/DEAH box helicase [Lewinella sp.]
METFAEAGLRPEILSALEDLGFTHPTPIQAQAIPQILESDQDLIALAQTGTGKTAAFGLPTVHQTDTAFSTPQTLVLCPTRELCLQITRDLEQFAKYCHDFRVVPVYGGAAASEQIRALQRGAQVVVGTPGRVLDLLRRKKLKLGHIARLVLDEADEMLNMGFQEDLDAILGQTPAEKQTLLFSATMPPEVERIAKTYMDNPRRLAVARASQAAAPVEHQYYLVQAKDKYEVLKRLADSHPDFYGIVFCRTRRDTGDVARKLMHDGYNADAIHGDLSQAQRDEVMDKFRQRVVQILVATDVAARGLDVKDLTHVINFNLPDEPEVYVHRSGRTGRAGKTGVSIAIIHSREQRKLEQIGRRTKIEFQRHRVPTGPEICRQQLLGLIDKMKQVEVNEREIGPFLPEIYDKLAALSREEIIQRFVSAEFNRFLAYYEGAEDINLPDRSTAKRAPKVQRTREERDQVDYANLYINVGSKRNLTPARLIGLINNALDSGNVAVGRIEIMPKATFFQIEASSAGQLMKALEGMRYNSIPLMLERSPVAPEPFIGKRKQASAKAKAGKGKKKYKQAKDGTPRYKGKKK